MTIEEPDFKLIPVSDSPFWDLELLYIVKPKGGEPRQEFKNAGYGMTLKSAIKQIVHYRICCKHKDAAIKLREYIKEYKEIVSVINNLCGE